MLRLLLTMSELATTSYDATTPEDKFSYQLLTGHARGDGSYKTSDQLRMEYLHLTDRLIHRITEGVEKTNQETGEIYTEPYDSIVFLDKSARPLSWLTREMWQDYAINENGEVHKMPAMKFLNIDREQWLDQVDPLGVGAENIESVNPEIIDSLRSIFVSTNHKRHGLEDISTAPAELDNQNILVVDEVRSTGRTLSISRKFLERAFPTAHIDGTHWMGSLTAKAGGLSIGNADLPVWYKSDDVRGRGVDNRISKPEGVKNITQRLGHWFLSTRFASPDPASLQLRKELKQLVHDPSVPKRPSVDRDDYEQRVERLNNAPFKVAQKAIMETLAQR